MAIVKVEKFNLICFKNDLNKLLRNLQDFVEVDFKTNDLNLSNIVSKDKENIEDNIYKIGNVLKKIKLFEEKKSSFEALKKGKLDFSYNKLDQYAKNIDAIAISDEINFNINLKENLIRENTNLSNEIKEYLKWEKLDITEKDIKKITKADIFVGSISNKNFENIFSELNENTYLEIISEDKKEKNILVISLKEENILETLRGYNFSNIPLDITNSVSDNILTRNNKIELNKKQIEEIDEKLKELSKNTEDLQISYEYYKNLLLKEEAKEKFKETDKLTLITGYIPKQRKDEFVNAIENICQKDYYLMNEEFDVNSSEVPVKIKNNKLSAPFELLVKTYAMPKYNEIDPTIFVSIFFWLFFGIMVADLGYGLILTIIPIFAMFSFKLDKNQKSIMSLVLMLGISTSIWGLLYGSFFGANLSNPLHIFSPTENYQPIMIMSIILGIVHIVFALSTKAYVLIMRKKYLDAIFDVLFWILTLFSSGYFIYAKVNGITDQSILIAKWIMIISMILIVLTGGREAPNIGGKLGLGFYALYGISGYVGDLISYIRLMALGLSGAYIAYSVNLIANMIGYKITTAVFAVLILVIGHGFNLFLSLLSAYVHSSRLIYVEYFSKFYEGGSKEFKDFKIDEEYINIKNN